MDPPCLPLLFNLSLLIKKCWVVNVQQIDGEQWLGIKPEPRDYGKRQNHRTDCVFSLLQDLVLFLFPFRSDSWCYFWWFRPKMNFRRVEVQLMGGGYVAQFFFQFCQCVSWVQSPSGASLNSQKVWPLLLLHVLLPVCDFSCGLYLPVSGK